MLPNGVYEDIKIYGIMTGSKVFGGWKKDISDIDYIIPPGFKWRLHDIVDFGGYYDSKYYSQDEFQSIKIESRYDGILNLLFMWNQKNFDVWKSATEILSHIANDSHYVRVLMKSKKLRVTFFESIKDFVEVNRKFFKIDYEKNKLKYESLYNTDDDIPY